MDRNPPNEEATSQSSGVRPFVLLNDSLSDFMHDTRALLEFSLFPKLQVELRLAIWKCFLERNRLIGITVDTDRFPFMPTYTTKNNQGKIVSGETYQLSCFSNHHPSMLLSVNHESRQAALEFYRVHLPLDFSKNSPTQCLYLNPEWDFLHIRTVLGVPEILANFVYDVQAYDPFHAGIVNLVWGNPYNCNELPEGPSTIAPQALSVFTQTLTNLKRVFFHHIVAGETRSMFLSLGSEELRYNRSYPLYSSEEEFKILGPDPRPIDTDLEKVNVGIDPRYLHGLWQQMERNFKITRSSPTTTEFRHLITASSVGLGVDKPPGIPSRAAAERFFINEEKGFKRSFGPGSPYSEWGIKNPDTDESLTRASKLAVGFWLFPVDSFGAVEDDENGNVKRYQWTKDYVLDLREKRPGLGVFRLPLYEKEEKATVSVMSAPRPQGIYSLGSWRS